MKVSAVILGLSLVAVAVAALVPGYSDLMLLALPCAISGAILLGLAVFRRTASDKPLVILDGSNVMHWRDNSPQVETLRAVLHKLTQAGMQPGIMFDANAGYLLKGRYMDDRHFARMFRLPEDRIIVVEKGMIADQVILQAARDLGARIVTNDRYRDWAGHFPEVEQKGFLITGGYRDGRLYLDLPKE